MRSHHHVVAEEPAQRGRDADGVAELVDDREARGVLFGVVVLGERRSAACGRGGVGAALGRAGLRIPARLRHVDQRASRCGVRLRQHARGGNHRELRIGHVTIDVGLRHLDRLDQRVDRLRRAGTVGREVESLDQVRAHQHFESAARGRRIAEHVVAAIIGAQRLGPLRLVSGQVGRGEDAAVRLEEAIELLRDVALVEPIERGPDRRRARGLLRQRLPLGLDELAQRRGVIRVLQQLAGLQRLAVGQEDLRGGRILAEVVLPAIDRLRQHLIDRIALFGVLDGRREHLGDAHRAELVEDRQIAAEIAGHDAGLHAGVERLRRHLCRA